MALKLLNMKKLSLKNLKLEVNDYKPKKMMSKTIYFIRREYLEALPRGQRGKV